MGRKEITLEMLSDVLEGRFMLSVRQMLPDGGMSRAEVRGIASVLDNSFMDLCKVLGLAPDAPVTTLAGGHDGVVRVYVKGDTAVFEKARQMLRDGQIMDETWRCCPKGGGGDAAGPV